MRLIAPIADRLLSIVVPRITAGACCPADTHKVACNGCARNSQHIWLQQFKSCSYTCACKLICGACTEYGCNPP